MNTVKISLKMIILGVAVLMMAVAGGIGGYYQKGVFVGPYMIHDSTTPVYLEFPVIATYDQFKDNSCFTSPFSEIGDYSQVAVYDIDMLSLAAARSYPLGKSFPDPLSLKIHFSRLISIEEAQKAVDASPKHPQYWQNRAQLVFYRFASGYAWLVQFNQVYVAIAGVLAVIWLWAFKSPIPFLIWWGFQATYAVIWRCLYQFYFYNSGKSLLALFYYGVHPPFQMYPWPDNSFALPYYVCWAGFWFIGPVLMVCMGWLYLTNHIIPRQKRVFEDFLKIDKDKDKKEDFNVTDVEFKTVKYDLRKKLEEYKTKPEFFLGLDDNEEDISIPVSKANLHFHIMGPTGFGKTASVVIPLAIQVLDKGYGACFVDFKGDYSLIRSVHDKCKQVGKKFYYFSIDPREKSDSYNVLASGDIFSRVDRVMCAQELDHKGEAMFYSDQQRMAFVDILKNIIRLKTHISLEKVMVYLKNEEFLDQIGISKDDIKGLIGSLSKIADYPMINEDGIELKKIMDAGDVVYFNLKTDINTFLAEGIGRMLIIDLKYLAAFRSEADSKFFIFVDEFETIASQFFTDVIAKVRSANYCLVLANQSRADLLTVSKSFHDAVVTNSHTKFVFNQAEDKAYWADKTGTIRVDEALMRMESGEMFDEKGTALDGKRVRDGVVSKVTKFLYSENVFLKLPPGKSIIFMKDGSDARLAHHEFIHTKEEFEVIRKGPFEYEGGKLYGDPFEYLTKQQQEEADRLKKQQEEERKKKDLKEKLDSKNTDSNKGTEEDPNKNKKKNKKGDKNESSQKDFLDTNGGFVGPVE